MSDELRIPPYTKTPFQENQSRLDSFFEALTNTFIGWFVAMVTWQIVAWVMAIPVSIGESFFITWIFTIVSIARSYLLRRVFNGRSVWSAIKGKFS